MITFLNNYFNDFSASRKAMIGLTLREFKKNHMGSTFGILWIFVQPVLYMALISIVKQLIMKNTVDSIPFHIKFLPSIVLWLFLANTMRDATGLFINNQYLLKQKNFNFSLLVSTNIFANTITHSILLGTVFLAFLFSGFYPSLYWLQLIYFFLATIIFLHALSLFLATIYPFFKDIKNMISIVIQFGFWSVPIFWEVENLPLYLRKIMAINPFYYLVKGYKDSMVNNTGLMEAPLYEAGIFWLITLLLSFMGIKFYRKLRPEFGEVF